jgi:hypothetical protein
MWVVESNARELYIQHCSNVGTGGLRLHGIPSTNGAVMHLTFRLPNEVKEIKAKGMIVRVREVGRCCDIGVRFVDLKRRDCERIARYVATVGA